MTVWTNIFLTIGFILLLGLYFTPTIIAFNRGKEDKVAILALNTLTGWTFFGWVISFVWSLTRD